MQWRVVLILVLLSTLCRSAFADPLSRGQVYSCEAFTGSSYSGWTSSDSTYGTVFSVSTTKTGSPARWLHIPNGDLLAGSFVRFSARVKGENLGGVNQAKLLIQYTRKSGAVAPVFTDMAQTVRTSLDFDWTLVRSGGIVPIDTTDIDVLIGIENGTGTFKINDFSVEIVAPTYWAAQALAAASTPYIPHAGISQLRGFNVERNIAGGGSISDDSTHSARLGISGWKSNVVRYQVTAPSSFPLTMAPGAARSAKIQYRADYFSWLREELTRVDKFLLQTYSNGMYVLIDLHSLPGGRANYADLMFSDEYYQDMLVDIWTEIAHRYNHNPAVWGYDIANEPLEHGASFQFDQRHGSDCAAAPAPLNWPAGWVSLATRVAKAIRVEDQSHDIVVESTLEGHASGLNLMTPLRDNGTVIPGVVYSFHLYDPIAYTHQDPTVPALAYATDVLPAVDAAIATAYSFSTDMKVPIFVGEFSVLRHAPNAISYLSYVLGELEAKQWSWTYHAYRGYHGWDAEKDEDTNEESPRLDDSSRERLVAIKSKLAYNQSVEPKLVLSASDNNIFAVTFPSASLYATGFMSSISPTKVQSFTIVPEGTLLSGHSEYYSLVSRDNAALRLGAGPGSGQPTYLLDFPGADYHVWWRIQAAGNGTYKLAAKTSTVYDGNVPKPIKYVGNISGASVLTGLDSSDDTSNLWRIGQP